MFDLSQPKVPTISAKEVKAALDSNVPCILLDVRTPGECARGIIKGALTIPVDQIAGQVETAIPNKAATIYVYCLSGSRSVFAVDAMIKLGYTSVFSMTSGLLAWRAEGFGTE
jgi:rhodanese-related sulfurtransferase